MPPKNTNSNARSAQIASIDDSSLPTAKAISIITNAKERGCRDANMIVTDPATVKTANPKIPKR